jgi:DNA-binding transcriptional LysR family regulator
VEEILLREELWLVSADGSRRSEPIPFAELAAMQLVLPLPRYGTRLLLDKLPSDNGIALRPIMEADNPSTIKQLVMTIGWSAVHSSLLFEAELALGQVFARPILPASVRCIALVT